MTPDGVEFKKRGGLKKSRSRKEGLQTRKSNQPVERQASELILL